MYIKKKNCTEKHVLLLASPPVLDPADSRSLERG